MTPEEALVQKDIDDGIEERNVILEDKQARERLISRFSDSVNVARQITTSMLSRIGINSSYLLYGGYATIFFHHKGQCAVHFTHQSECSVIVMLVKNNRVFERGHRILWAPSRDPWIITYLIAGFYRIKQGVYELHYSTDLYCKYGHMRNRCEICGFEKSDKPMPGPMKFRLTPLWPEDDPERATDKSLNLAHVSHCLPVFKKT